MYFCGTRILFGAAVGGFAVHGPRRADGGTRMIFLRKFREGRAAAQRQRDLAAKALAQYHDALTKIVESREDVGAALAALPIPTSIDPVDLKRVNELAFRRLAESFVVDDLLTETEETALLAASAALGIDDARMRARAGFADILDDLLIARVNDGRLPELEDSPLVRKRNEVVHATMGARLLKEVVLREYRGAYSGFSFRVMKGVRYHTGGTRGHSVVVGSRMEVSDDGVLVLTSQRAVFLGSKRSLEFAYPKLLDIHVYSDGIRLAVSNRQTPSVFELDGNSDVIAAILNAAAARLQ